jgi:hypothetical protein
VQFAQPQEIHARCAAGDYLAAALLQAGRVFGGLPDVDPSFDAILVAHHVTHPPSSPPWPEWAYDLAFAQEIARTCPNAARLTFLSAQLQVVRDKIAAADPFPDQVAEAFLEAFNDFPEVRNWLADLREATGVPGLWEQVCQPAQNPAAEYCDRLRAFTERYETGLLQRSDKAAYIRRQDYYMSRQQAFRLLRERLGPTGLVRLTAEERGLVESWLKKKPEGVTQEWHESTERTSGKVKLHGNQRTELVRRAAEYLEVANRVWRAALDLGAAPVQLKDVERLQRQLRESLPAARNRARGQPWGPVFHLLAGRIPS